MIDAHIHVSCGDTTRYPRQPAGGMGSDWWTTYDDASDILSVLVDAGVDKAVIVHTQGLYGQDCRCAADVFAANPDRCALVAEADMAGADPAASVAGAAAIGATGVRLFGMRGDAPPAWLFDGRAGEVWAAAAAADLVVVPTLKPHSMAALGQVCSDHPETVVVLDHGGFIHVAPDAQAAVLPLVALPSVHVKVSTHNLDIPYSAAWLREFTDAFGAERLCWGSDFPQIQTRTYAEIVALAGTAAEELDEAERSSFFVDTSTRLFWRN